MKKRDSLPGKFTEWLSLVKNISNKKYKKQLNMLTTFEEAVGAYYESQHAYDFVVRQAQKREIGDDYE